MKFINKIKSGFDKKLIEFKTLKDFLDESFKIKTNWASAYTDWINKDETLEIGTVGIEGKSYIDKIERGGFEQNPYNCYINGFGLWDILNKQGKEFFLKYYASELQDIKDKFRDEIRYKKNEINKLKQNEIDFNKEIEQLTNT